MIAPLILCWQMGCDIVHEDTDQLGQQPERRPILRDAEIKLGKIMLIGQLEHCAYQLQLRADPLEA